MADFFDVAKFPGPRAMEKRPKVNLEFALIGDGVPAQDVYKVLATKEGVDRAFKKLTALKPHVKVWWEGGAKPPQLLSDGEVAMSTAYNGRIYDAVKKDNKPFKIVWDGQIWDLDLWAIPKGAPKLDLIYDFIKFASDPNVMANQSKYISYGPVHVDAVPKIAPDVLPHLPTAPANFKNAVQSSTTFWADKYDEINQRFQAWLAQ
jgi:putative spermidine/putrescine transport system substrate-binding protein